MTQILAINPGSTSTKVALYEGKECLWKESIEHSYEEVSRYRTIYEQYPMRVQTITELLDKHGMRQEDLDCIVGRGGPARPFVAGAYRLNRELVDIMSDNPKNSHISLLGGIIAYNMAEPLGIPSFIYDPVTIDELEDVARVSGLKGIARESAGHFLNMRAAAYKVAEQMERPLEELNFLLAHLGGGITVAVMKQGKVVDLIGDDEGPFSPERTGGLPLRQIVNLCYENKKEEVHKMLRGSGGIVSYTGVTDLREVEERIQKGDKEAKLIFDAMAYQIANWLSFLAPVVYGKMDGIILTGGMAFSERLTKAVTERIAFLGEVFVIPGENELESLAYGAYRVLTGEETAHVYTEEGK